MVTTSTTKPDVSSNAVDRPVVCTARVPLLKGDTVADLILDRITVKAPRSLTHTRASLIWSLSVTAACRAAPANVAVSSEA